MVQCGVITENYRTVVLVKPLGQQIALTGIESCTNIGNE